MRFQLNYFCYGFWPAHWLSGSSLLHISLWCFVSLSGLWSSERTKDRRRGGKQTSLDVCPSLIQASSSFLNIKSTYYLWFLKCISVLIALFKGKKKVFWSNIFGSCPCKKWAVNCRPSPSFKYANMHYESLRGQCKVVYSFSQTYFTEKYFFLLGAYFETRVLGSIILKLIWICLFSSVFPKLQPPNYHLINFCWHFSWNQLTF